MPAQFIHEDDRDRRIQELEAEVKAMRNAEARYRGIIENMELGIMEVDSEERVVRAHPRFCEIVGYSEEELTGKRASALLLDEEARANMDAVTASRNAGDSGLYETPIRTKQGELKWLLISGVPIHNPDGDIIGSMGIHYDITERKRDEQRMVRAMQDAEAARQTEREFLARISHEIRTPMTAILGMTRLLGDTSMSAEQRSLWKAMLEGGEVLKQLLDGVLNLTRLDAGRMEVQEETVDVAALVSGVVAPFRPPLAEKGVELMVLLPETGTHLQLDGSLFTQVLMNLLGNAVKFTDQGAVSVEVSVVAKAGEERELHLAVTDSGVGIPEEDQDAVFQRFHQASNREFRHQGSGLGLSIVKDIVALVGGELSLRSERGRGTRFDLIWPTATAETQENRIPVTMSDDGRLEAHVLIAEDNEINALLLRTLLERWGATVELVDNGEAALEAWRKGAYSFICMDVQMPVRDGMWATRRIRDEESGHVPILGLSAFAFDADKQAALDCGMDAYLTKPFSPEELKETVRRMLA